MKSAIVIAATLLFAASGSPAAAQDHSGHGTHAKPAVQAFEHYEGVRMALAADKLADATPHAKQLAASVEPVAGADAKKAAEALAAAATLDEARKHFGALSTLLVPKFQEAGIEGTTAFMCSMKNQPWMQRGTKPENPYYGPSMLSCGSPITPKGK